MGYEFFVTHFIIVCKNYSFENLKGLLKINDLQTIILFLLSVKPYPLRKVGYSISLHLDLNSLMKNEY